MLQGIPCALHTGVSSSPRCFHSQLLSLPSGVTFSFFWKTQDQQAKLLPASGGRVISSGFKICSNEGEGSVEFYTRGSAMMKWKASFSPPGRVSIFKKTNFFVAFIPADRGGEKSTTRGKRGDTQSQLQSSVLESSPGVGGKIKREAVMWNRTLPWPAALPSLQRGLQ